MLVPVFFLTLASCILPLLSWLSGINNPDYSQYQYLFVIATFSCVVVTIFLNHDNIEMFNLDKFSILVLVLSGIFRINVVTLHEETYKFIIVILDICLFLLFIINREKFPKSSFLWAMIAIILSLIVVMPLAFFESFQIEKYATSNVIYKNEQRFLGYVIKNLLYNLSFVSVYEEIAVRGLLWGQLCKMKFSDNRVFIIQGVLFWLLHFSYIGTAITFFLTLPLVILGESVLVKFSKQLFPSILFHLLVNLLIPIIVSFYQ